MSYRPLAATALMLVAAASSAQITGPVRLNDTGATACLTRSGAWSTECAGSGQDAAFGRDTTARSDANGHAGFHFTKIGSQGQALPASATSWRCVADRVTGLTWQVNTDNGSPLDSGRNFTNWGDGRKGDASAVVAQANRRQLCGANDWRLPTITELQSLIDYGTTDTVSIDNTWFPNSRDWWVWTSTGYATDPEAAWAAYFSTAAGGDGAARRDFKLGIRLVRGGTPVSQAARYTFSGDEVTDTFTGLVWRRCAAGQAWKGAACTGTVANRQWPEALAYARDEARATGQAWRLPNAKELSTLADRSRNNPAIDPAVFPNVSPRQWYWTSTPFIMDPSYVWTMDFYGGYTQTYPATGYDLGIRLVRDAR